MSLFVQIPDPDNEGQFKFVEATPDQIELPEDVLRERVFKHPEYEKVKAESIKRKNHLKELQEQLAKDTDTTEQVTESQETSSTAVSQQTTTVALDEDALFTKFTQRLAEKQAAEAAARKVEEDRYAALAAKHSLNSDAIPIIATSTDPEATAALLAKTAYRFDDSAGGSHSGSDSEALMTAINKKLNLGD